LHLELGPREPVELMPHNGTVLQICHASNDYWIIVAHPELCLAGLQAVRKKASSDISCQRLSARQFPGKVTDDHLRRVNSSLYSGPACAARSAYAEVKRQHLDDSAGSGPGEFRATTSKRIPGRSGVNLR